MASSPLVITGSLLGDIFPSETRGMAIAIFVSLSRSLFCSSLSFSSPKQLPSRFPSGPRSSLWSSSRPHLLRIHVRLGRRVDVARTYPRSSHLPQSSAPSAVLTSRSLLCFSSGFSASSVPSAWSSRTSPSRKPTLPSCWFRRPSELGKRLENLGSLLVSSAVVSIFRVASFADSHLFLPLQLRGWRPESRLEPTMSLFGRSRCSVSLQPSTSSSSIHRSSSRRVFPFLSSSRADACRYHRFHEHGLRDSIPVLHKLSYHLRERRTWL